MIIFFEDLFYLGLFLLVIFNIWNLFMNDNFYYLRTKLQGNDKITYNTPIKKNHFFFFLKIWVL